MFYSISAEIDICYNYIRHNLTPILSTAYIIIAYRPMISLDPVGPTVLALSFGK